MTDAQAVQPQANQCRKINVAKSPAKSLSSVHVKPKASPVKSQCYPKSLSVLEMLKMGKVLNNKRTTGITLHSFIKTVTKSCKSITIKANYSFARPADLQYLLQL